MQNGVLVRNVKTCISVTENNWKSSYFLNYIVNNTFIKLFTCDIIAKEFKGVTSSSLKRSFI